MAAFIHKTWPWPWLSCCHRYFYAMLGHFITVHNEVIKTFILKLPGSIQIQEAPWTIQQQCSCVSVSKSFGPQIMHIKAVCWHNQPVEHLELDHNKITWLNQAFFPFSNQGWLGWDFSVDHQISWYKHYASLSDVSWVRKVFNWWSEQAMILCLIGHPCIPWLYV